MSWFRPEVIISQMPEFNTCGKARPGVQPPRRSRRRGGFVRHRARRHQFIHNVETLKVRVRYPYSIVHRDKISATMGVRDRLRNLFRLLLLFTVLVAVALLSAITTIRLTIHGRQES